MNDISQYYAQPRHRGAEHITRLREEIAYLEARLDEIGGNGDCAYEKSLARSYVVLLKERRDQLTRITN